MKRSLPIPWPSVENRRSASHSRLTLIFWLLAPFALARRLMPRRGGWIAKDD